MTNRRQFCISTTAVLGAAGLGLLGCSPRQTAADGEGDVAAEKSDGLDILILGGTGFIGPHMVREAQKRGHTVTLFNRGKTNTDLFPEVETLIGDRDGQLGALEGRSWDAVIDNSGYIPRHVMESAQLLSGAAKQYLFISSVSAYANFEQPGIDEDYVLGKLEDETDENMTGETYGPMKALAERHVAEAFADGSTIVRPGYIVGPGDRTDRWTYWPLRVRAGGEMIVPGTPDDPVQYIDARDLARFVVDCLENRTVGTFNAVGPESAQSMSRMLETIRSTIGSDVAFRWVDASTLEAANAAFPIWAPPDGQYAGLLRIDNSRAIAAGMTFTTLEETTRATLDWWDTLDATRQSAMRSGLRIFETEPNGIGGAPMSLAEQMAAEARLLEEIAAPAS